MSKIYKLYFFLIFCLIISCNKLEKKQIIRTSLKFSSKFISNSIKNKRYYHINNNILKRRKFNLITNKTYFNNIYSQRFKSISPLTEILLLNEKAESAINQNNYEEAAIIYEKVLEIYRNKHEAYFYTTGYIHTLCLIFTIHDIKKNIDKQLSILHKILEIDHYIIIDYFSKAGNKEILLKAVNLFILNKDFKKMSLIYEIILAAFYDNEENKKEEEYINIIINLGTYYLKQDNKKAIDYLSYSLKYYELKLKNSKKTDKKLLNKLIIINNNIGTFYLNKKDYNNSIYYFQKTLDLMEQFVGTKNHVLSFPYLFNLGIAYHGLKNYQKAIEIYESIPPKNDDNDLEEKSKELNQVILVDRKKLKILIHAANNKEDIESLIQKKLYNFGNFF